MKRRGWTLLVGGVMVIVLTWLTLSVRVPYVLLGPGPTVDTLGEADRKPVIQVDGAPQYTSQGQLRLVTVGVTKDISLPEAVWFWMNDDYAVVPRELIFPPDKTDQQVDEDNTKDFKESQSTAETAALRALGFAVQVKVKEIEKGKPADGKLQAGDQVTTVDGQQVTSATQLRELITAKAPGGTVTLGYVRDGKPATVAVTTAKNPQGGKAYVGITSEESQPHPFTLKIDLDNIGGPSAGLMFALGIIDKLKPEDLTGGAVIAGTGTIDGDGNVGPIGGVPQKLVAAREAHAKAFLTPADNCAEALANAQPGLKLAKVKTLDEALKALDDLKAGREPALCSK